jgi:hypothetical protein
VLNWQRTAVGLAIADLGLAVFLRVPLPDQRMCGGFAQLAISAGGLATLAGVGVVMSAFREN